MIEVNDYVVRTGSQTPTGIVESITDGIVTVRWGISDKRVYREPIWKDELIKLDHDVVSPDDISKLRVNEDGNVYLETED